MSIKIDSSAGSGIYKLTIVLNGKRHERFYPTMKERAVVKDKIMATYKPSDDYYYFTETVWSNDYGKFI